MAPCPPNDLRLILSQRFLDLCRSVRGGGQMRTSQEIREGRHNRRPQPFRHSVRRRNICLDRLPRRQNGDDPDAHKHRHHSEDGLPSAIFRRVKCEGPGLLQAATIPPLRRRRTDALLRLDQQLDAVHVDYEVLAG